MWVLPAFSFPIQITYFYAKSWSLYADVSVIPSKWSDFQSEFTFWVHTRERCPIWPSGGGRRGGGVLCCVREVRSEKLGGGVDSNGWVCAGVCNATLSRDIYCAKPNQEPDAQYSSRVCRGLGTRDLQRTWEYNLSTTIAICLLTQPEIGSSIITAMIRFKVVSTTWASLIIIPSNERKNGEKCFRWQ